MCGICGSVGVADEALVRRMTKIQAHRGPDGEGIEVFSASGGGTPAALGHRRLSIIDPSERGAQPMSFGNRYWITYNGELYNFKSLRSELESSGSRFASDCDTEVLLAMYARHGAAMLEHLNGIFAFAIWDTERQELFLARDRLGVKPLYYAWRDGSFHFASEAKALLEATGRPSMRVELLPQYLAFLWIPEPDTLFDGVFKLPPGHYGTVRDGKLELTEYWDLRYQPEPADTGEWAARLREKLEASVRRQMVSDVPLGAFLSGGVDSSAVVASMNRAAGGVTSYSIGFAPEDQAHEITPDDLAYARRVAGDLGVDNHERVLDPEVVELLPRLVWHLDEPIADPATISSYLICAAARERLTVILSGMGADEIFAGYPRHLAAKLTRHADLIPRRARLGLRRALEGRLTMGPPGRTRRVRRNALEVLRGIDQPGVDRYLAYSAYYRPDQLGQLLSAEAAAAGADPFARHRAHAAKAAGEDWLSQILYVDMKTFLPSLNLAYTDKMSMAASTEVRVPLLDDELVALAARIPAGLKLHGRTGKHVLKQAVAGLVPDYVVERPKAGFGAPIRSWLTGELKPLVDDLLAPSAISSRGLFDPAAVGQLVADNEAGVGDHSLRVWALLVLELWQRTFIDGGHGGAPSVRLDAVSSA